jgi:DedD protein
MDSRAKQRLTGAVILVALFVLLVPELLTGPRVADAPEGAPTDEGMRRYTIDLDASVPPAQSAASAAQSPVALPPAADERAQPGEAAAPAATAAPRVEPQQPPAGTSVPTQGAPTQSAATSTPAPALPPSTARGSFAVQLGTFGSRENADRLVRDMTAKGFTAFVAPFTKEGHELYRVRVGPTRDRATAETLAGQLRHIGQSGSIVPIS